MTRYLITATLSLALTLAGCKSQKNVVTPTGPTTTTTVTTDNVAPEARLDYIASHQSSWTSLQAGGNVKLGGPKSLSSSMQMRMVRDESIYISLRLLGIEAAKILVTRDSVLLVDKYHKRYLAEPVSLLTNGLPATVGMVQDIFLGRAFVLDKGTLNNSNKRDVTIVTNPDGSMQIKPLSQPDKFTYAFDIDTNNHIVALNVLPQKGAPYTADYSDFQNTIAGPVAHRSHLKANIGGTAFTLQFELKNLQWNTTFSIDTSRPGANYKRYEPKQIGQMFGKD